MLSYVQHPALLPTLRFTFAVSSYNPATHLSFIAAAPLTSQPLTYQSSASARAVAEPWGVIPLQLGLALA